MDKSCVTTIPSYLITFIIMMLAVSCLMFTVCTPRLLTSFLPPKLLSLDVATRLRDDHDAITLASTDFGKLVRVIPAAVLYPSSEDDIVSLVRFSYNSSSPFTISARGFGHSIRGQAMAHNGVVVNMRALDYDDNKGRRINVSWGSPAALYADVGGEQLWIDVLKATLEYGLAPRSWTDYLYLTVGGTLSNAGKSGQTFRHGPQISNVYEMDVITGRGELVTCSKHRNSELFHAVLGGLGQFGIITRARIILEHAPNRVKWVRMLYDDFSFFTRDQERLITVLDGRKNAEGLDYLEGSVISHQNLGTKWRSSFFSSADHSRLSSLITQHGIGYCIEVAKYYDNHTRETIDEELQALLEGLSYNAGFIFARDVSYVDFLNRVRTEELKLQAEGLWDVPHPWLNLLVPKSQISEFNSGVFKGIFLKQRKAVGPILIYPMNRNKWDEKMSAVTPEEDIFYYIGLLNSGGMHGWEYLEDLNREVLQFCVKAGIKFKQYIPHYETKEEWIDHFGSKWKTIQERKTLFDPKAILSPGQRIFTSL